MQITTNELRDEFAKQALPTFIKRPFLVMVLLNLLYTIHNRLEKRKPKNLQKDLARESARRAYLYADAMIEYRQNHSM